LAARATLVLVDEKNPFQQLLRADAQAAARRTGLEIDTLFTGDSFTEQTAALRRLVGADAAVRPGAVLVMAVRDHGLSRVVREAAAAGVHFVFLNATEDDLEAVRREAGAATVTVVCPDEVETGRVQGRQLRALVPAGRRVLYVQGNPRSLAARQRTAGMQEATSGAGLDVVLAGGDWSPAQASRTVREWLRLAVGGRRPFDLVACQNDDMASGVLEALAEAAAEAKAPDLARIPVTGCDGAPDVGQRMVREGRLAATVVLPRVAGPAVEVVSCLLLRGERPDPHIFHSATSFPPLEALRPPA
jgi:ribose transport system substrate-binding protein/inositol transport system substrate-binding protein